jgi:hypothetical protein
MGVIGPKDDYTSQRLYDLVKVAGRHDKQVPGALAFYGRKTIIHVAMLVEPDIVIESGGGSRNTLTIDDAVERMAFVREMPLEYRSDLKYIVYPAY